MKRKRRSLKRKRLSHPKLKKKSQKKRNKQNLKTDPLRPPNLPRLPHPPRLLSQQRPPKKNQSPLLPKHQRWRIKK